LINLKASTMKNFVKLFIYPLFLILIFTELSRAQPVNTVIQGVVAPAPEAASLGKYSDIPVDYSRGVPNISIPIYNVTEGPLSVPITLSYHASGIRVREISSWVGTGWSLSAGGMISRVVQGKIDDGSGGFYRTGSSLDLTNKVHKRDVVTGDRDGEPDIFTFNLPGYAGKFYFDENKDYHFIPENDLKVEVDTSSGFFDGFTIVTPEGTRYIYGSLDNPVKNFREWTNATAEDSDSYTSGWYLIRIESYDGKHYIDFDYQSADYFYEQFSSCSIINYTTSAPCHPGGEKNSCLSRTNVEMDVEGYVVKTITSSTTTVTFTRSTDRQDISGAPKLDEIKIESGQSPNTFCKEFDFSYDYFEDDNVSQDNKRLKLEQVQEKTCAGDTIPAHRFTYYGPVVGGKNFMVHRFSKEIDHWGYYNGATQNTTSSEKINIPATTLQIGLQSYTHGDANRSTNFDKMVQGALEKIEYPTGGSTTFEYEANSYAGTVQTSDDRLVFLESCEDLGTQCCNDNTVDSIYTFTDSAYLANAYFDLYLKTVDSCLNEDENEVNILVEVFAYENSNWVYKGEYGTNTEGTESTYTFYDKALTEIYSGFQLNVQYKFELTTTNGYGKFSIFSFDEYTDDIEVGGLRIKKITTSDGLTSNDIVREYSYSAENDTLSSGKLMREPVYAFTTTGKEYEGSAEHNISLHIFSEESLVPLSSFEGYHIAYERVEESIAGNGKSIYLYDVSYSGISNNYPNAPQPIQLKNGKLKHSMVKDESGNTISENIITPRNITYSYSRDLMKALPFNTLAECSGGAGGIGPFYQAGVKIYNFRNGIYQVKEKEVILDGVSIKNSYAYDPSDDHFNPIADTLTNSDGKKHVTQYKYANEMDDAYGGSVWSDLINNKNMVGIPFETTISVDGTQVGGSRTQYVYFDDQGSPNSGTHGPYPYLYEAYEMTWDAGGSPSVSGWDTIGTVMKIDTSNGFPKTFTQRGWEKESFEWDSSNDLIKKRTFEDFTWQYSYYSGTGMVSSITDVDGQVVNYEYDQLMRLDKIKAREDSIITDYEYDYYSGTGTYNSVETTITFHQTTGSGLNDRTTIQYLDGLGRGIQTVEKAYSENQKDVISAIEFDNIGRPFKAYEAFEGNNSNGNYVPKASWPDTSLYTLTNYEASPLNRETGMRPPNWHFTTTDYSSNTSSLNLAGTSYSANTVFITTLTDPNGHKTISYKDKKGRDLQTIRRSSNGSDSISSVFIYDDKDRLSKVLPPSTSLSNTELIYSYTYDERDNIISKKLPEQLAINYWYDERNLVTYMQDPNMADQGRWLHTQYDDYGRATASGFVTSAPGSGGTKANFAEALTRTYYDGYDFVGGAPDIYKGKVRKSETRILGTSDWLQTVFTYDDYGRVAISESNHHQNLGNTQADVINFTYDFADNVTFQSRTHEYTSGYTTIIDERMVYDHSGRLTKNFHQVNGGTEVQLTELSYTAKDQIAQKNLGKVASSFLQSLDYTYRDNGFLSAINQPTLGGANMALGSCPDGTMPAPGAPTGTLDDKDLFYLQLRYDTIDASLSSSYKQYNGNISQISWRVRGRERQVYAFKYDYLDRLISSEYGDQADNNTIDWSAKRFNTFYEYDDRGNFTKLSRQGHYWDGSCWQTGQIDTLTYDYWNLITGGTSNRLRSVSDGAPSASKAEGFSSLNPGSSYDYDANGNMTFDPNKDMDVLYNYLNPPKRIEIEDCKFIELLYDASGTKLRKTLKEGAMVIRTHDYIGGLEYTNDSLEAIYHSEGRVYFENGTSRYEYNLADHLGNTRLTFTDKDGDGVIEIFENADSNEVLSENHYYPFGMQMEGSWMSNPGRNTKYRYNNKELNEDFGLDWYDYGARWYDPAIGRWHSIDPLAEKYYPFTEYNYTSNNPILFSDPRGMDLYITKNRFTNRAFNDLLRLVNQAEFEGEVTFSFDPKAKDGYLKINVNFGALSQEEIDSDVGLSLLRDVTSARENFLYDVTTRVTTLDRNTKEELEPINLGTPAPNRRGNLALNISINDREDGPDNDDPRTIKQYQKYNGIPLNGFHAHIAVSPFAGDAKTPKEAGSNPIPREWFTFHELQEAYYRTHHNQNYKTAHENANNQGASFYLTPQGWGGVYGVVNPWIYRPE